MASSCHSTSARGGLLLSRTTSAIGLKMSFVPRLILLADRLGVVGVLGLDQLDGQRLFLLLDLLFQHRLAVLETGLPSLSSAAPLS